MDEVFRSCVPDCDLNVYDSSFWTELTDYVICLAL